MHFIDSISSCNLSDSLSFPFRSIPYDLFERFSFLVLRTNFELLAFVFSLLFLDRQKAVQVQQLKLSDYDLILKSFLGLNSLPFSLRITRTLGMPSFMSCRFIFTSYTFALSFFLPCALVFCIITLSLENIFLLLSFFARYRHNLSFLFFRLR